MRATLPAAYGYDARGNQIQAGARTFTWDLANRPASTSEGGATTTYGDDGDGARLQASTGATATSFRWGVNLAVPQLALERDGDGHALARLHLGAAGTALAPVRRADGVLAP